jgi:hypothetical protein
MSTRVVNIQDNDKTSLKIREFSLNWMCTNPSICMIAKRGSGKSWVVRSILKHFRDIPGGVIISPTDKMSGFYNKFFPDVYIHHEYQSDILKRMFFRQTKLIETSKEKIKKGKKVDPRAILVMDDCLSSKGAWMKDDFIREIFMNGRHFFIMYILTMQFPLGITPELRSNFDYIFLLADDFISNQKRLYDHYAGMFPNFDSFRQVFINLTGDFGSMVIVNRGNRSHILDKVFWFKSDNEEISSIGCKQFQKFHSNNYNKDWRTAKDNERIDIEEFVPGIRKKPKFNIVREIQHEPTE